MYKIDKDFTATYIGFYIGIMGLIFLNIFIALISSTFTRVYDKAEAYITFQRADEILKTEILMQMGYKYYRSVFCLGNNNDSLNQYLRSANFDPFEHDKN